MQVLYVVLLQRFGFDGFLLLQAAFVVSLDEEPQEYDRVSRRVISGYWGWVIRMRWRSSSQRCDTGFVHILEKLEITRI